MISNFPWPIFVVAGALLGTLLTQFVQWAQQKQASLTEAERIKREAEHKERKEQQLRDQQLNHGRRVFNWLKKELKSFEESGLVLHRLERNGEAFSIHASHVLRDGSSVPILQVSYDFVDHTEPYLGHVHYGAYGADGRFHVNPKGRVDDAFLRQFVIKEIEAYFESRSHI